MFKPLAWLTVLALLSLSGLAYGAPLPTPPKNAELVQDTTFPCDDGKVVYWRLYDVDPNTQAAVAVLGPMHGEEHGDPFLVVVADDMGVPTFYVSIEGDKAQKMSLSQFTAAFGSANVAGACNVAMSVRTEK